MTRQLEEFKQDIIRLIAEHSEHRDFNDLLNALLSDINDLSDTRFDVRPIITRMLERLNTDEDGNPTSNPFDTRNFSQAFQITGPIAMSLADVNSLIEIMRRQVFVYTATGTNLDDLGRDYDFPRFQASRAIRQGFTLDTGGNMADFPIGSRLMTRNTGEPIIFEIYQTQGGNVLFRHVPDPNIPFIRGDVGNTYFGDLSPASPINGIGQATITDTAGAYQPGQNQETDEAYRIRFLRFLRRKAFGGNVAQYQQEIQPIDGVGDLMVFPVFRGEGTTKVLIVDVEYKPVSQEFVTLVNNQVDPFVRSGAGFGFSPVGHRVLIDTTEYYDINIYIRAVLMPTLQEGQVIQRFNEIADEYFAELRQSVIDEWERTYFSLDGGNISNAWVDVRGKFEVLYAQYNDPRLLDLMRHFPAENVIQTHNWLTLISGEVLGARMLETRLISALDFRGILINGADGRVHIQQNQDKVYTPRLISFVVEFVPYIEQKPTPPPDDPIVVKRYITGADKPMSELSVVEED